VKLSLRMLVSKALVVVVPFLLASVCQAQSCALCYTQAAAAGSRFIQGLRSGIVVLIIPPMFMSIGITMLAYRKRNQCAAPEQRENSSSDW